MRSAFGSVMRTHMQRLPARRARSAFKSPSMQAKSTGSVSHVHTPSSPAYASIRQHMSAYVSIRLDTSEYVRIRQDTSGFVRIRQDTSGYVRIRLDCLTCTPLRGILSTASCQYQHTHNIYGRMRTQYEDTYVSSYATHAHQYEDTYK
jgi:hypothetical protein